MPGEGFLAASVYTQHHALLYTTITPPSPHHHNHNHNRFHYLTVPHLLPVYRSSEAAKGREAGSWKLEAELN